MDWLIYIGILVAVGLVAFGGVYLKRKFDIQKEDLEFAMLILNIVNYITSKFEFKYSKGVQTIIIYCIQALIFVEAFDDTDDLEQKIQLIKDKALEVCIENGVEIDDGIEVVIDEIVEYLLRNGK